MLSKVRARAGVLLAGAILVQGGLQAVAAQDTTIKIAVVDLERVFVLSNPGKELQAKLEKFQQDVQAQGTQMTEKANEIRKRAAEGGQTLTEDKLAELQTQYEDEAIAIRRFREEKQREGERLKNEGLRVIEQQLEPVFKAIRDERGYDLILNNVPGIVVMANEKVDITQEIVERLNAATSSGG
jgi:Skp family chaperone for outer membrane proteins